MRCGCTHCLTITDPFDRLLVAQAQVEAVPLPSRDLLAAYGVELRW